MSTQPDRLDPAAAPVDAGLLRRLLEEVLAAEAGMLAVKDLDTGRYALVDAEMARFLGADPQAVAGRQDADLFETATATALRAAEQTALAHGAPMWSDHRVERQGQAREFSVLRVACGQQMGMIWIDRSAARRQAQQLQNALEQLEQLQRANAGLSRELAVRAKHDPSSGLYTRSNFEDQLRREADLSVREQREFALAMVELDPPRPEPSDRDEPARAYVLDALGRLLRGGTRAMDASCRYDDNRFAVLLSGVGLATAHARMEGLRRRCATQIVVLDGRELAFTVAMGVAAFPHTAQTLDGLLSACDAALGEARARGGNHVTLASIPLAAG